MFFSVKIDNFYFFFLIFSLHWRTSRENQDARVLSIEGENSEFLADLFLIKRATTRSCVVLFCPHLLVNLAIANLNVICTFRETINRYTILRENNRRQPHFQQCSPPRLLFQARLRGLSLSAFYAVLR